MVTYATVQDVAAGYRELTQEEADKCSALIEEAAVLIDSYASYVPDDNKRVVTCRMIRRVLANTSDDSTPIGATQGSVTAGPYTQSWTMGGGSSMGELYLSRTDKQILGVGNRIGSHSPLEDLSRGRRGKGDWWPC